MLPKTCFCLLFHLLVQSRTASVGDRVDKASLTSVVDAKTPQLADQTFNINNWGLGNIDRKMLTDIKGKIDSLSDKGKCLITPNKVLERFKTNITPYFRSSLNLTPFWFDSSVTQPACPEGWVLHGNSCFLIINIPTLNWSDARRTCQNLGGDLAIIRSAEENNFILGLVKKQKTITDYGVWLGLTRKSDNKFYWIDDTPLEGHYSQWASGQPVNGNNNEHCGNMFAQGARGGKWNDLWCSREESYLKYAPSILCQKRSTELTMLIFNFLFYFKSTSKSNSARLKGACYCWATR